MVKIAPDKSLPQTKNRGQRLTLTCHLRDIRHQPSLSGGQRMGDSHASERICRPKNLPITTDDMETELGRLRDTDIDDDSPVIRSKDRRRKLTDECKRQPLAAYRFGGLECMLLGPGEGGLMSMIG